MRDVILVCIIGAAAVAALRHPWVGVMLWTWVSSMNPHRYTYGFAFDLPVAAIAAGVTLLGLLITQDKGSPFKGAPTVWLLVFAGWITLSWQMGMDPKDDFEQWSKVMKIYFMVFVTLALLHSKKHIFAFAWVVAMSIALLGAKGGLFTIATGGTYRVWGPPETFIAENNAFAVAVIMTIPLVRFLQLQIQSPRWRLVLTVMMLLMAASALGSQSRGALLGLSAMTTLLWFRMKRKRLLGLVVIVTAGLLLVSFMPESWEARMGTMRTYQADQSAMGRIAAWWVAWNLAFDYPFGVGFMAARDELFRVYSQYYHLLDGKTPVAHSIYFQTLGHHGFVGLGIFLGIWITTWRAATRIRRATRDIAQAQWCHELASLIQVSLVGYFVGGAFLDLAYFDLPYNIMILVLLTEQWVKRRAWESEPTQAPRGLAAPKPGLPAEGVAR